MSSFTISAPARQDLRDIQAYLVTEAGVGVTRTVMRRLRDTFQLLANRPGIGHARADLTNEAVKFWQVYSYMIVYDPATNPIGIARVLHSSRDLATLASLIARVDASSAARLAVGGDQVRKVRFEGKRLVLVPLPTMLDGIMQHREVFWERISPIPA